MATLPLALAGCSDDAATPCPPADAAAGDAPADVRVVDATPLVDASDAHAEAGSGKDVPALRTACAAFAEAFCSRMNTCSPLVARAYFPDCKRATAAACVEEAVLPAARTSPTSLAACTTALANFDCTKVEGDVLPDECEVAGAKPVGALCANRFECASLRCSGAAEDHPLSCGRCQRQKKEGEACQFASGFVGSPWQSDCESGLHCVGTESGHRCVKRQPRGSPCNENDPASCEAALACIDGKCGDRIAIGQRCGGLQRCVEEAYCDTTRTCAKLLDEGAPCKAPNACAAGLLCLGEVGTTTCQKPWPEVPEGQPCGAAVKASCETGKRCVVADASDAGAGDAAMDAGDASAPLRVCKDLSGVGAACNSRFDCAAPMNCIEGTCQEVETIRCDEGGGT